MCVCVCVCMCVCGTDGEQCSCSWYRVDACDWHQCWLVRHDERQGLHTVSQLTLSLSLDRQTDYY